MIFRKIFYIYYKYDRFCILTLVAFVVFCRKLSFKPATFGLLPVACKNKQSKTNEDYLPLVEPNTNSEGEKDTVPSRRSKCVVVCLTGNLLLVCPAGQSQKKRNNDL